MKNFDISILFKLRIDECNMVIMMLRKCTDPRAFESRLLFLMTCLQKINHSGQIVHFLETKVIICGENLFVCFGIVWFHI
mmetsp:Transcript_1507/g.3159  ORF Transcript_1507/g.3159 Transcript_1507/m.3159 type:complete len:80 (+) Transcript_1507:1844-2083(+)